MSYEKIVVDIIVNVGNARSHAMEAIRLAKAGRPDEALELIEKAGEFLEKAHNAQTHLIQEETAGNGKQVTLLMVHAQDHLMNAMTVRDLAREFIELYEELTHVKADILNA
jgi:PTS system cellobiose-specific IIA component